MHWFSVKRRALAPPHHRFLNSENTKSKCRDFFPNELYNGPYLKLERASTNILLVPIILVSGHKWKCVCDFNIHCSHPREDVLSLRKIYGHKKHLLKITKGFNKSHPALCG